MYSYLDIDLYRRPNPPNRLHEYGRKLSEVTEEFLKILLLISISLISAITIEVRPDLSGLTIRLHFLDAVVMIFIHFLLVWGLRNGHNGFIWPWLVITGWTMYLAHYACITKMWELFTANHLTAIMPWITFGLTIVSFVLRILLAIRVLLEMREECNENELRLRNFYYRGN